MVLWIRGWIVTYMRLYHAIFSGRPLASHAQVGRMNPMKHMIEDLWLALTDWRSEPLMNVAILMQWTSLAIILYALVSSL